MQKDKMHGIYITQLKTINIQYIYNFNVILENYTLHITHEDWLLDFSI
jgi:hypothetical protein